MIKLVFLMIAVFFGACSRPQKTIELPYYDSPDFTPLFKPRAVAMTMVKHRIGDFAFTDQHGKRVTAHDTDGKVHVANFFFSSCGSICPKMMANMKKVQNAFAGNRNVVLLSYSVTPWVDNARRLEAYAQRNGIHSPDWHLLTGDKSEIYTLARRSYFAEERLGFTKDSTQFLHTEHILLVDGDRKIRGVYNGTLELEADQLIADIRTLLASR